MVSITSSKLWFAGILTLVLGLVLFFAFDRLSVWHWQHVPLHSTLETLGGVTAVMISTVLFLEAQGRLDTQLILVATGFVSMGVLDAAHAMSRPGDAFIFLHSVASLSGGFFFALSQFFQDRRMKGRFEQFFIFLGSVLLSVSVGVRALAFPGDVPRLIPLFDEKFTMAAVLINTAAGLLFLMSVPGFYLNYRKTHRSQNLLFVCLASLFGIAEMTFQFSSPWNGMWWAWHLIRLSAFLVTLVFVFLRYKGSKPEEWN